MHRYVLLLAGLLVAVSCDGNLVYSEYRATDGGNWGKEESMHFEFNLSDSISRHDVFINIRNDDRFPYSNLFLIATLNFPNGQVVKDTLEYEMAYPDGRWMGKGAGSIKENKLWYKEKIIFPLKGVYTFDLEHAMRRNGSVEGVESLPGITDVGLEISKSNQ